MLGGAAEHDECSVDPEKVLSLSLVRVGKQFYSCKMAGVVESGREGYWFPLVDKKETRECFRVS